MPKPFGKPVRRGMGFTRLMRLTVALWGAAIPAFLLCRIPARGFRTLVESPFFWPSAIAFGLLYAASIGLWLRRRPSPRGPWEAGRARLLLARLLLALLVAAPAAFASAYLYAPMLALANGMAAPGGPRHEFALVTRGSEGLALTSPYWRPDFRFSLAGMRALPEGLAPAWLARLTVRRGLLGAPWVDRIEFEALQ